MSPLLSTAGSSSGLLSMTETWKYWNEPNKGPQKRLRDWNDSYMGKDCESWDSFCLEKVEVRQNLVNVCKTLRARCKEEVTRLLSVEPGGKARGKGQKLKGLHLNVRIFIFIFLCSEGD